MRKILIGAVTVALAACGSGEPDELVPAEPYEHGHYSIPAGISFPEDVDFYGGGGQTSNGVKQVSFTFVTKLSTAELLEFFAGKNMLFSKQDDDTYERYAGKLANDADIELKHDKVPAGANGETIYSLTVFNVVDNVPMARVEAK